MDQSLKQERSDKSLEARLKLIRTPQPGFTPPGERVLRLLAAIPNFYVPGVSLDSFELYADEEGAVEVIVRDIGLYVTIDNENVEFDAVLCPLDGNLLHFEHHGDASDFLSRFEQISTACLSHSPLSSFRSPTL